MFNFCLFFVLLALTAAANAQANSMENYLRAISEAHNQTIEDMDVQIMLLKDTNLAALQTIDIKSEMLVLVLHATNNKFDSLRILNTLTQKCVDVYRQDIPAVTNTTRLTQNCRQTAEKLLPSIFTEALRTRNELENYYKTYDATIAKCVQSYNISSSKYSMCVTNAVSSADSHTRDVTTTFTLQMNTARGYGGNILNDALTCSYTIEQMTISSIAQATNSIEKCRTGNNICIQSHFDHKCSEVVQMKRSDVDVGKKFIQNPFYQRSESAKCVMLQLV